MFDYENVGAFVAIVYSAEDRIYVCGPFLSFHDAANWCKQSEELTTLKCDPQRLMDYSKDGWYDTTTNELRRFDTTGSILPFKI